MKKTLYAIAFVFALSVAAFGALAPSHSNVMAKGNDDGISASL